jgi:signal transduction histidine kinase
MITLHYSIIFAVFLLSVFVLFLTINSKPINNQRYRFLWLVVCLLIWNICSFLNFFILKNSSIALIFTKVIHVCLLGIPFFAYLFYLSIINIKNKYLSITKFLFYIVNGSLLLIIVFTDLIVSGVSSRYLIKNYVVPGKLYFILIAVYLAEIILVHIVLAIFYKSLQHVNKKQAKYLFFAGISSVIVGSLGFVTAYLDFPLPELGTLGVAVYIIIACYAIIKHKLLDIQFVISRTIARLLMYIILASTFLLIYAIHFSGFNLSFIVLSMFFVILVGEFYILILRNIQKLPDKLLLKHHYDYKEAVQNLTKSFEKCIILKDAALSIETSLKVFARATEVKLYFLENFSSHRDLGDDFIEYQKEGTNKKVLFENEVVIKKILEEKRVIITDETNLETQGILKQEDISACIPCIANKEVVGLIVVKKKESNETYNSNDQFLFEYLCIQTEHVLDRIRAYEKVRSGLEQIQKTASISDMINSYNHELKSPWNRLVMLAEFMDPKKDYEGVVGQLKKVQDAIRDCWDKAEVMINTMGQILSDQFKRDVTYIEIKIAIESVFEIFPFKVKTINKNYNQTPLMKGNMQELQILFSNLIKNAVEAIDNAQTIDTFEGMTLTIDTSFNEALNKIEVVISDTGEGIPEDKIAEIWKSGFTTKNKKGGTGIGMSVVKRIVNEHNGEIFVTSKVGEGTSFKILFNPDHESLELFYKTRNDQSKYTNSSKSETT